MRQVSVALLLAGLGAIMAHQTHLQLDRLERPSPRDATETLPSAEALGFLSLGYQSLVADYYWLRAINHFGDIQMHRQGYPNLIALVERVLALDPYFETAYTFAGTALTVKGLDPRRSIELLEQGLKVRPDLWRISFLLGFNYYYFLGDYAKAAQNLGVAAKHPEAPPVAAMLATRLAAEADEPEIGIRLIDSLMEELGVEDEKLLAQYHERRKKLMVELHIKWLNQAVQRFLRATGRMPPTLEALVQSGHLRSIPTEPLGGRYVLNEEGLVTTTLEEQRLRLAPESRSPNQ